VYEASFGKRDPRQRPYPVPLAVIQINEFEVEEHGRPLMTSIPELFALEELSIAPPEFLELANLVCVISNRSLWDEEPPRLKPEEIHSFARELFRLLLCARRGCNAALSQGRGTCLSEKFITAAGACNNFYFLTSYEGRSHTAISAAQHRDVVDGFEIIIRRAESPTAIEAGITESLRSCTDGRDLGTAPRSLTRAVSNAVDHREPNLLAELATIAVSEQS